MSYLKHKPGSIEEMMANQAKKLNDNAYQDMFKKELEKAGRGIGAMSPKEKKDFFNKIDDKYKAKNEEEVSKKDVDKFHTSLDKLVHKSFGHSSDEKKKEVKEEDAYDKDDEKPKSKPKKEAVDNPYAVGMAAAMKAKDDKPPLKKSTITKAHDIAKSIEKDQKEEVSQKEIDKFHTSLDKLVHKSFGHSSDEKKKEMKKEEKDVPKGYHKMPDGKIMKDSEHKKEEVKETHSFVTNKQNQKQKEVGGEKEPIKTPKNEWKTFAMMAAELREKKEEKEDKKEMQAGDDTRDKSKKTMTGQVATSPEMNPKVDYKY